MGLLEKLKRKKPRAKNPVFVEAGRRGGIRSGQVRRAKAEQRRLLEEGISPTELAEKVAAILKTPIEPRSLEPIEETASPATVELVPAEETTEEVGTPEASVLSSLERALDEAKSELSDIRRLLPSQQHVEKAMEELEYIKHIFEIPYTMSILEKLSNRGAGEVKAPEEVERGIEALREEAKRVNEEVDRILRGLL